MLIHCCLLLAYLCESFMRFENRITMLKRVQFFWHLTLSLWTEFPTFLWHYEPSPRQVLPTQWHIVTSEVMSLLIICFDDDHFFFINAYSFVCVVLFCVWKQWRSNHVGAFIPKVIVFLCPTLNVFIHVKPVLFTRTLKWRHKLHVYRSILWTEWNFNFAMLKCSRN
jgi:hypothetical protein